VPKHERGLSPGQELLVKIESERRRFYLETCDHPWVKSRLIINNRPPNLKFGGFGFVFADVVGRATCG